MKDFTAWLERELTEKAPRSSRRTPAPVLRVLQIGLVSVLVIAGTLVPVVLIATHVGRRAASPIHQAAVAGVDPVLLAKFRILRPPLTPKTAVRQSLFRSMRSAPGLGLVNVAARAVHLAGGGEVDMIPGRNGACTQVRVNSRSSTAVSCGPTSLLIDGSGAVVFNPTRSGGSMAGLFTDDVTNAALLSLHGTSRPLSLRLGAFAASYRYGECFLLTLRGGRRMIRAIGSVVDGACASLSRAPG